MTSTTRASFRSQAERFLPAVEAALERYSRRSEDCPESLGEAIRYSLLAPGKRLRPLLVLWAAEACGGPWEKALPAACAVEMIHAYSLIHDDLPAMDDDDLRRGRPTNHKVYGEATAILAGDALQALAFEVLAREITPAEAGLRCCLELAHAAGAAALVGGQAADLAAEHAPVAVSELESIHRRKTGALFLACLRLGAITAGAEPERVAALDRYGRALGLAFQIMDDVLDVAGSAEAAGKRLGKDADRGKQTFPGLLGVDESRRRAEALIEQACAALAALGPGAESLEALARYVVERDR